MKITDMLVSGILRRGVLYEARNCDMEVEIPITMSQETNNKETEEIKVKVNLKVEHMKLTIEKGRE